MAALVLPWPVDAPQYANQWDEQKDPVTVRSTMDIGPPKVRRRYTRAMSKFTVSMVGSKAEGDAVQSFFDSELQGGVNFHTFLHPFAGTLQTFRFTEAPAISNLSSQAVTINMTWEQL